jgi:hypothetical protein
MPLRHLFALAFLLFLPACTYYRTTDPTTTADQQFLLTEATSRAVEQLSAIALRDRVVFVDPTYLNSPDYSFLIADVRARLLVSGVRLTADRGKAQVILEVRSGGIGIDRQYYILGLPSFAIPATGGQGGSAFATPEIAIVKNQKQRGYASVAFVAYLADSGELLASSGPFVGRSRREDYWLFFTGPRATGDIPTVERPR